MPDKKLPIPEFAAKLKAKYPQYRSLEDTDLVTKITNKYPQYRDAVDLSGISKKKEDTTLVSEIGGEAGTSVSPLVSEKAPKGFEGLKPARVQPVEIKEPSVGEDTVLARKLAREQKAAAEGTGVRLPAAPKIVAEEKAAERALAPKIEKPKETEEQSYLSNIVSSLDRGFYKNIIGNPVKGLATVIKYGTSAMTGGRVKEGPVSDALNKFGDWYNNAIDEIAPQDESFKNSLSDQFFQAFGQVGSVVFTGGLGAGGRGAAIAEQAIPATGRVAVTKAAGKKLVSEIASPAAVSAGLTMGQAEFDRAKQAGASDDQAFEAFYKNAAVGSILEKIPVMQFLKRFNQSTAGGLTNYIKTKGVAGITGGLEEATTEVLQQVYANKTAKDIYNVNQNIFEGLTESGGIGFGVGFLLNAMGARAKVLRNEGKQAEAKVVEDQVKEFESRASKGEPTEVEEIAPEMRQYAMEAPKVAGEPEQISKPIELSVEPQVPAAPEKLTIEQQKESIATAVKEAGYDVTPEQLDRIYDSVVDGDGIIEAGKVREILQSGYSGATAAADYINELGIKGGEVVTEAKPELPAAPVALRDVESTAKALEGIREQKVNKSYRAEISNEKTQSKGFIPSGYYEKVGKNDNPVFFADEYAESGIAETAASKNPIGAILGTSSMSKFGKRLKAGDKIQVYEINEKPDVDISHWLGADFGDIQEVRYRKNTSGQHKVEIILSESAVKLINDYYDIKAFEEESKYDEKIKYPKYAKNTQKLIDNDTFNKVLYKELSKNNPELVKAVEDLLAGEVTEAKPEIPQPIRQLGTGANVYFESNKYRVNDDLKDGKILLNVGDRNGETPLQSVKFENADEAVFVAKRLEKDAPEGLVSGYHNIGKIIDNYKDEFAKQRVTEAKPELPAAPVEEELPFGEGREVKARKQRQITNKKRRALNIEIIDDPRGEVLQYFIGDGKISEKSLANFFESEKQGYRWKKSKEEEKKLRKSLISKDPKAPSIEELAEKIAGVDRFDRVQDFRNAIEEVILNHNRAETMADELVRDYDLEFAEMKKSAELEELGKEIEEETQAFVSQIPVAQQQEILKVLDKFRDNDGFINWRQISEEIKDGFEPVILELSEPSQKIINDAIKQFEETGRVGRISPEALPTKAKAGDAARKLAERIRAGKISKEGLRTSTGFDVVFDAALEVIATSLEAGASIADAIESGLNYIRDTEYYKNLTDKKGFEDKFSNKLNEEYAIQEQAAGEVPVQPEAGVSEEVEAGVPPTRPTKTPEEGETEGRKEERRFTERMIQSPGLLAAVKKGIAPTLEYVRQTNAMTVDEAQQILNVLGEDKAYNAMKDSQTKGAVRVVLGQVLIKRYNQLAKEATTQEDKDLYIGATVDIAEYVTVSLATEAGQTIQAFSLWDKLTPEAQLLAATRQVKKSARRNIGKAKNDVEIIKEKFNKANEEAVKEILKSEEVTKSVKKDTEVRISNAKDRAAKARQKRADIIKKYKGKGGITLTTGGLTKEGIEFVGEVAVTYIEEGLAEVQVIVEKILADIKNISGKEPNETVKREVLEIADKELAKSDIDMVKSVKDKKMKIDEIAIQHFTSKERIKKSLAQKFIEQADMSEGNAEALAKRFEEAFDRVVSRKKTEILAKNKKRFERVRKAVNEQAAVKAEPKTLQDEIIKYSNLGAFDTEDMLDYLSDKFKLGQLTKEQASKIKELADKIQTAPEGTPKREATEDLLAYQANLNGGNWGEVAQGIWYANILSGYRTHEKNVVSTFINSWVDLGAEIIGDPKSAPYLIAGYIQGIKKRGLLEAGRTLATGRSPIHVSKIEVPEPLERIRFIGGGYNPANWFKYANRTMKAEDVLSFQGLKEARSYQLARKEASKLGFNTWSGSGWKKVNELLFNTAERYELAAAQAESEGLKANTKNWKRRIYELIENSRPTQMTEDAYNFAAHGTFNYESDGTLGAFTNAVSKALDVKVGGVQPGRFVVPFTRIITNVVNNALDYSPVGLIRVAKGARGFKSFDEISLTKGAYKPFTPEQRRIVAVKAAIGISFAAMFQYMAETGQIQISGEGPEDEKKKAQLRESGWQAYSIKIGDKWYSYQLTPLALVLGMLGNFNDAANYGKDDEKTLLRRLNVAALKFGGMIADMTWINSAGTFLGAFVEPRISEQQRSVEKALSGMARGFVPFSQMTSQATQAYNSIFQVPAKQVNNSWEALYQDLPIARNSLNDKINALGEPVIKDVDIMVSREKADPVWKFLTEKQGWVAPLSKKTVFVFDEKLKQDRPLTDNEFYELSKLRGSIIKENIKKILTEGYPVLRDGSITYVLGEDMTSAELNNILSKRIEPMATKEAKAKIFGIEYSEMEKDEMKAELTELEKEYWGLNDN